jgi:hypothetical protein
MFEWGQRSLEQEDEAPISKHQIQNNPQAPISNDLNGNI